MGLFRKSEPEPAPEPVSQTLRSPAPCPTLEAEVRAVIWQHMSPELARAADLSLSDVSDWIFGVRRLSTLELEAIARKIGLLTTPVSGLEVIRAALAARLRRPPDWGPSRLNRTPDRGVNQGEVNPSSAAHAARLRAFADGGEIDLDTLNEFVREHWGPGAFYDPSGDRLGKTDIATLAGSAPAPWTGGSNVPAINEMVKESLQTRLRQLEALA
jgi:hypothetical protein